MKRRDARELAFKLTYEMVMTDAFNQETKDALLVGADADSRAYVESVVAGIEQHKDELKALITKYARGYEFDRIYKTDLAVLYLACYEITYTDTPKAVVANEAVEIAKAYSDTQSYSFVNGILASVIKGEA
ncbi:MAG: transcription antitermination factor NusB [Clostridiales bacterium]|nr:transcription antitermination factor NusB [Clostridiales bacterium]